MRKNENGFLRKAKKNKNDEFYTRLGDIERELQYYEKHFKNKIVFCNCDDPVTSNFFKYQGKIYVFTLNDGMQVLENVDMETFKAFEPGDYFTQNIALDKNSVYFGNVIIPDLDPNKLEVIGNGYYTDGTTTYFCSSLSERNKDLSTPMEILQSLMYSFSKTKKPQSYIYPYIKIKIDIIETSRLMDVSISCINFYIINTVCYIGINNPTNTIIILIKEIINVYMESRVWFYFPINHLN